MKRAPSVPGLIWSHKSASFAASVFLGSTTISLAPSFSRFLMGRHLMGPDSVMLLPTTAHLRPPIFGCMVPVPVRARRMATLLQ